MKKLLTIKELAAANGGPLPMSESGIYAACRKGLIKTVKIGRRIFVTQEELEALLEREN